MGREKGGSDGGGGSGGGGVEGWGEWGGGEEEEHKGVCAHGHLCDVCWMI